MRSRGVAGGVASFLYAGGALVALADAAKGWGDAIEIVWENGAACASESSSDVGGVNGGEGLEEDLDIRKSRIGHVTEETSRDQAVYVTLCYMVGA